MKPVFDRSRELANLPDKPGIYRMYDAADQLLYVGKAKSLRNRVRSYFVKNAGHTARVRRMIPEIARFDTIVTDTEVEALILEDNFIKEHQPPYNVLLKDDKRYPWLMLTDEAYPRLLVTRRPQKVGKKTRYFGPYTSSSQMYTMLRALRRHFPLRQRRRPLFRDRPCMNYHLGLCSGPCQQMVSKQDYDAIVQQVTLFLKGQTDLLLRQLNSAMESASEALEFEKAAKLRDRIKIVSQLSHSHKLVSEDTLLSQDVIALAQDEWMACVVVLSVRGGKVIASRTTDILLRHEETSEEVLEGFLLPYYRNLEAEDLPVELLLPYELEVSDALAAWMTERRGGKKQVKVLLPKRGKSAELLAMASQNAQRALEQAKLYESGKKHRDPLNALLDLQDKLGLPVYPQRMECYDISHFQGAQTVASMVVFTDGGPDKAAYRRFKVRSTEGKPDDFTSMHETLSRRSAHLDDWGEPDLIIIDGGKGQLNAALEALNEQGWQEQPIISLAKRYEEVYLPGQSHPVLLAHDTPALQLLQQIRDEAHRFAITYHRQLRTKKTFKTPLDDLPGVGPKIKSKLLQHYQSWQAISNATPEDLSSVLGGSYAKAVSLYEAIQARRLENSSPE